MPNKQVLWNCISEKKPGNPKNVNAINKFCKIEFKKQNAR